MYLVQRLKQNTNKNIIWFFLKLIKTSHIWPFFLEYRYCYNVIVEDIAHPLGARAIYLCFSLSAFTDAFPNIAIIANTVQCHSQLSGNKDCHEKRGKTR